MAVRMPKGLYCSVLEAAERLAVTDRRVRQMVESGQLKAYDFGPRCSVIPLAEVNRILKTRQPVKGQR